MMNPIAEAHNTSSTCEQQSQFGVSQSEPRNTLYDLSSGSTNQQQVQIMSAVDGSMNWPASEAVMPAMTSMGQSRVVQSSVINGNGGDTVLPDLWAEEYRRIELMMDGNPRETGWHYTNS
jgi:hypothetical protein